jgi:hypothetical protein
MTDQIISFQVAKLAKEKGFNVRVNTLYQNNGSVHTLIPSDRYPHLKVHHNKEIDSYTNGFLDWNSLNLNEDERLDLYSGFNEQAEQTFSVCCSAPTQSLLQKWLREKHNLHIDIPYQDDILGYGYKITTILNNTEGTEEYQTKPWCYEEALEEGLLQALTTIP